MIATVERCRHCGCEWVCPDCGGVAGAQPPAETPAPRDTWSGTIDGYRFAVRVGPAEIGPDVAVAVLLQDSAPEIVLDGDHARRVIAVALRDMRRRAEEAERERGSAVAALIKEGGRLLADCEERAEKAERERDAAKAIAGAWAAVARTASAETAASFAWAESNMVDRDRLHMEWQEAQRDAWIARAKLESLGVTL